MINNYLVGRLFKKYKFDNPSIESRHQYIIHCTLPLKGLGQHFGNIFNYYYISKILNGKLHTL